MNKPATNYIVLLTTFVYLAFACLYVIARTENNAHVKLVKAGAVISGADNSPGKGQGNFLARPRVVNQKLVVELILPVATLILSYLITGSSNKAAIALPVPLPVRYCAKTILLRAMRL